MITLICQECFSNIGIEQRAYKWQAVALKNSAFYGIIWLTIDCFQTIEGQRAHVRR